MSPTPCCRPRSIGGHVRPARRPGHLRRHIGRRPIGELRGRRKALLLPSGHRGGGGGDIDLGDDGGGGGNLPVSLAPSKVAVMVAAPAFRLVTVPGTMPPLAALLTDATVPSELLQTASAVTSRVEASEYVAVACSVWVNPTGKDAVLGNTAKLVTIADETVSVAVPLTAPTLARTCTVPGDTPMATPLPPAAFDMEAAAPSVDQAAVCVTSTVEPSEYVAVAVNGSGIPAGAVGRPRSHANGHQIGAHDERGGLPRHPGQGCLHVDRAHELRGQVPRAVDDDGDGGIAHRPGHLVRHVLGGVVGVGRGGVEGRMLTPTGIVGCAGVTSMLCKVASVTVALMLALMVSSEAVTTAVPGFRATGPERPFPSPARWRWSRPSRSRRRGR